MNYNNNLEYYLKKSSDVAELKRMLKIVKVSDDSKKFDENYGEVCKFINNSTVKTYIHGYLQDDDTYSFDREHLEQINKFIDTLQTLCQISSSKDIFSPEELRSVTKGYLTVAKKLAERVEYYLDHLDNSYVPHYTKTCEFIYRNAVVICLIIILIALVYYLVTYEPVAETQYMTPDVYEDYSSHSPISSHQSKYDYPYIEDSSIAELYR